jgi:hypothetical protein
MEPAIWEVICTFGKERNGEVWGDAIALGVLHARQSAPAPRPSVPKLREETDRVLTRFSGPF